MATCKDCLHYDVCIIVEKYGEISEWRMAEFGCESFKDKSQYAEVKHGKWTLNKDGSGTCDQCHFTQKNVWGYDNWQNYCGVCGAKMDGRI